MLESLAQDCDLWIVPPPRHSRWFTHIDWYLNWQMCKGLAYGGLHLSAEVHRLVEEYGVESPATNSRPSPLLISGVNKIPAAKCLVLDNVTPIHGWIERARQIATGLNARTIRVFLPRDSDPREAERAWPADQVDRLFIPDLEKPE